jgi:hypothetical protein
MTIWRILLGMLIGPPVLLGWGCIILVFLIETPTY